MGSRYTRAYHLCLLGCPPLVCSKSLTDSNATLSAEVNGLRQELEQKRVLAEGLRLRLEEAEDALQEQRRVSREAREKLSRDTSEVALLACPKPSSPARGLGMLLVPVVAPGV